MHLLLLLSISSSLFPAASKASDVNGTCFFDDRMNTLRCEDADWRTVRARLAEVSGEVATVFVNFCRIRSLPAFAFHSENDSNSDALTRVSVVNSGLESVTEGAFAGLEDRLEHLDLSHNRLTTLPTAVLELRRLVSLDLSGNSITRLPHGSAFNSLDALVLLDLSSNLLGLESDVSDGGPPTSLPSLSPGSRTKLVHRPLSLLSFNLEPLTDTLQELHLKDNGFQGLPKQLQDRHFSRLRILDVSQNPLGALPRDAFNGMKQLELLNMQNCRLQNLVFGIDGEESPPSHRLRELRLAGNPLRCDCHARWLWKLAKEDKIKIDLPRCATPFSVRNADLTSLADSDLCELILPGGRRVSRFYRISDQDRSSFPPLTFESLTMTSALPASATQLNITWQLKIDFYFSEYDWGLIFREVGGRTTTNGSSSSSMFYKTGYDLTGHIEHHESWTPRNETISTQLDGLKADTYYEVCLAAIDHATVFYIHRNNCREVRTPANIRGDQMQATFLPGQTSITVMWKAETKATGGGGSILRRISLRQFGTENVTHVNVLDDLAGGSENRNGSRHHILPNLLPATAYLMCFDTLSPEEYDDNKTTLTSLSSYRGDSSSGCSELLTLPPAAAAAAWKESFPVKEVAAATAVSTSTTVFVVAIICCCCYPGCCRKKRKKKKNDDGRDPQKKDTVTATAAAAAQQAEDTKDENDNHQLKSEDEDEEEGNDDYTLRLEEDNGDIEVSSDQFRATIIAEGGPKVRRVLVEEGFGERYSNATESVSQRQQEADHSPRRFWQSCLPLSSDRSAANATVAPSANSSLYSHYDYTVHSEAAKPSDVQDDPQGHRRRHRSEEEERPSSSNGRMEERRRQHHHQRRDSPDLTLHRHQPRRQRRRRHSNREGDEGDFLQEQEAPYFYCPTSGSGNYHTISHFQFYRRPLGQPVYYAPQPPHSDQQYYQFRLVPPPSFDYARTLGRRRRESPMATIPLPVAAATAVAVATPQAFELKPLSLKKMRNRSSSSKRGDQPVIENNKMYTWSPYSNSLFYAERMAERQPRSIVTAASVDYPYQLREPFLGKKRIDELRF